MPSPRPMFEIYVHSRKLEGIHLRGGKVARGGIRWSDRHDDFRTEILGLMKTQMVKNAIIVPVGSKGGFVLKGERAAAARARRLPDRPLPRVRVRPARRHRQPRGRQGRCIRPRSSATTTTTPTSWWPRTRARRTSRDTANSVSAQYGFWLGDAFASGGSVGYDHKKMGITARGAWECVRAPLPQPGPRRPEGARSPWRASGTWRATSSATACCGAGRRGSWRPSTTRTSSSTPTPDPETSFAERERLFALPRSTLARLRRRR